MTSLAKILHSHRLVADPARQAFIKLFLVLYIPAAIFLTGIVYGVLKIEVGIQSNAMKTQEASQVTVASNALAQDLDAVASDLMVLAHAPYVKRFIENPGSVNKEGVTELFADMSGEKRIYDQIRLLDLKGMEVIRVNLEGGIVKITPADQLQDKSGRYFFQDSIKLQSGEIYVSPMDLNIEHGKVEVPYKPMMRFATPVFDHAGEKKAVVITNLYGSLLINHFRQAMGTDQHAMLVNRDGDWLSSPDPSWEWGFMFGNTHAFAKRYPSEWKILSGSDKGSLLTEAGLFTYATVYPLLSSHRTSTGSPLPEGASSRELERHEYFWKVVSLVPPAEIPSAAFSRHPVALALYVLGLLLLAMLIAFLAVTVLSRRQLRQTVFDNETRLREITSNLAEGVYVLNAQGVIVYVNPEAERLLGWYQEGLLGQDAHGIFHHHRADGTVLSEEECPINAAMRTGQLYRNEDEAFWRKDNSMMPVSVSSSPIIRRGEVVGAVVAFQDATERKNNQEAIRRLAEYDTLTNLPNRRLLLERLDRALAQAHRYRRALALMFLDLDQFKEVNDTLGHDVGDTLLKEVASRLNACVRNIDTVARLGGDEFVILLVEISRPEDATVVADKILFSLSQPIPVSGHNLQITGSIGIAIRPVDGAQDAQELMKMADIAMYAAKQGGRNRYCIHGR